MKNQTVTLPVSGAKKSALVAWCEKENQLFSCVLESVVTNRQVCLMTHASLAFSALVCAKICVGCSCIALPSLVCCVVTSLQERRAEMKEEGFNPNAVITDQVIDALANIQDHEPGSFREHTEKLTDILLDDFELMEPDNLKRNLDLVQFFRFYAGLIEKLHPQSK